MLNTIPTPVSQSSGDRQPAGGKETTMKVLSATTLSLMITGTQALASGGGQNSEGIGLLATFFLAFCALIILFQFIPGLTLFFGILKGIFSSANPEEETVSHRNTL
jgi:hypothetical protein